MSCSNVQTTADLEVFVQMNLIQKELDLGLRTSYQAMCCCELQALLQGSSVCCFALVQAATLLAALTMGSDVHGFRHQLLSADWTDMCKWCNDWITAFPRFV